MPLLNEYPAAVTGADYIVPFPYGSNIGLDTAGDPTPRLSVLSQMAIDAGVEAWRRNPSSQLVLIGETPYPAGFPNTTDLMVDWARELADVPDSAIVPLRELPDGTPLNNTHLQAEAAWNYIGEQGDDARTVTVTLDYHQIRVRRACEALGLASNYVTVETVLNAAGSLEPYQKYLPYIAGLETSERILRMLARVDGRGRLVNLIAKRQGARMVDVVEDERDGVTVITLENTTAAKKLEEVKAVAAELRTGAATA